MKLPLRPLLWVLFAAGSVGAVGCSLQAEGARCSLLSGNSDCNGDLVCKPASTLRGGADGVPRCCPQQENEYEADACAPIQRGSGTGGQGGAGNEGGSAGAGAAPAGGTSGLGDACEYDSQCAVGLFCLSGGKCGHECLQDRDCPDGKTCNADKNCE